LSASGQERMVKGPTAASGEKRMDLSEEIGDYSKVTGLSHHAALALCRVLVV